MPVLSEEKRYELRFRLAIVEAEYEALDDSEPVIGNPVFGGPAGHDVDRKHARMDELLAEADDLRRQLATGSN